MRGCALMALPSTDEAFGVAYVEAMAARIPAIGCLGEPGPEEIARCGDGIRLVPPGDVERLAAELQEILAEPAYLADLGRERAAHRRRALHLGGLRRGDGGGLRGGAALTKPVLFVTNFVAPDRVGAFQALHERVGIELLLFGGRSHHATGARRGPGRAVSPASTRRDVGRALRERAARWSAARPGERRCRPRTSARDAAKLPFILWSALWHEPRTPAHLAARPLDAPHPPPRRRRRHLRPARVRARTHGSGPGASSKPRRPSTTRSGAPPSPAAASASAPCLPGRDVRAKGLEVLRQAWDLRPPGRGRAARRDGRRPRPSCATSTRQATSW